MNVANPAGGPKSRRLVVLALAPWFGVSGSWTLYWETHRAISAGGAAEALSVPEDDPMVRAGEVFARISTVTVFGVLALVAATGLLVRAPWARSTAVTYLLLAIVLRLLGSAGVLVYARRIGGVMSETPRFVTSTLSWWAMEIGIGAIALVYLKRTDPSRSAPRSADPFTPDRGTGSPR